ncbi:FecR domain-containing protein [Luteolibacter sp. Populi]|uniref:FecR domain-containing protein n=1 Tax=Luteolibacter sp. Populi TaxID=3230487 RepID=UPI0034671835
MEEQDINRLLNRLIDGTISQEDFARLQGAMRVSPEVRAEYYDLIGVDLMLAERYEVPTHISVQAKAMNDHWVVRRSKHKVVKAAVWAAAACVLLTLGGAYLFRDRPPAATLTSSFDCQFTIDGSERSITTLKEDEMLEVKNGVLSMSIGPHVKALIEAPARLRLTTHEGRLDLQEGSVFLQILPGGKGFEVHTPGGIIRDIGTKFGVHVAADGTVETHVSAGTVEIDREDGQAKRQIRAGEMAIWNGKGAIRGGINTAGRFVEDLPWEETIFDDNFDDPDGTVLDKKKPDTGLPWATLMEMNPSTISGGMLDTSTGPRSLQARFKADQSSKRRVYIVNFSTQVPGNIWDKAGYPDAAERITFLRPGDAPLFSLVARASRTHHWQIKNELNGDHSIGTRVSSLLQHDLTLTYDSGTGEVRLYKGSSTKGTLIDQPFKVGAGNSLDSVIVSNDGGGDVALENFTVRMLTYPQNGDSPASR